MGIEFDVIVIGSGITGGWAAKELAEKGLKTLLLDRGREVRHGYDYITENKPNFELPYRGQWPPDEKDKARFNHDSVVVNPGNYHFFNDDRLNPYVYEKNQVCEKNSVYEKNYVDEKNYVYKKVYISKKNPIHAIQTTFPPAASFSLPDPRSTGGSRLQHTRSLAIDHNM